MQTFQNRPQTSMPFNKRLQYSQNIRLTSPTSTSNNKYYNTTNRFYSSRPQKRPQTSLKTISNMTLFKKESRNTNLDVLNLILETNPSKYDLNKIAEKINTINPFFTKGNFYNRQKPNYSRNTEEVYYKYNILYGSNTTNLITTYSPKMRPMSASIHLFQQKMLNMEENQNDVFNYDEVEKMCKAKCNDIGIELRDNMIYKFNEYCKNKGKNRQVDFTEMYLGYYSIKILAKIIKTSDRISYLNLTRNNIGDKGLELLANALSNSKTLVALNLTSNSISHKGADKLFKILDKQESLIYLNVSSVEGTNRNRIGYMGLKGIPKMLSHNFYLETLNLSGNSIKNEGISLIMKGLNHNQTLKVLDCSNNDIDSEGIQLAFEETLKQSKINELYLNNNKIYDEGIIKLTESFPKFQNIHKLCISNCGIEFKGFHFLLTHLEDVKRIEELDISCNDIHSDKFDLIKPIFQVFGLKKINLSKCNLGDKSTSILGESIGINESLKSINISENRINDKGFKTFVNIFKTNNIIEKLDVSHNYISDATVKPMIENLKYNHSLRHLNLFDNQLKNDIGTVILDLLTVNKTLMYINVLYNRVQMKNIEEIKRRLKLNAEKIKKKFVPNLQKQIKEINVHPDRQKFLEKKICEEQNLEKFLKIKVAEDDKNYKEMKIEDQERVNKTIKENEMIENEIKEHNRFLSDINSELKTYEKNYDKDTYELHKKIKEKNQEIDNVTNINLKLKEKIEKMKIDLNNIIEKTKEELELSKQETTLAKINLNKVQENLILKQNELEELIHPTQKIIGRRDSMKSPKIEKRGSLKKRMSSGLNELQAQMQKIFGKKKRKKNK